MIAKERNTFYIDLYNFKIAMWLLYYIVYLCKIKRIGTVLATSAQLLVLVAVVGIRESFNLKQPVGYSTFSNI